MKKNIFLYLFVFAALIALYILISGSRKSEADQTRITSLQNQLEQMQDSIRDAELRILDMQYFSLENNDEALAYYDHLELEDPAGYIADKLLETNEGEGDNPLVPYAGMESAFKINKIKILNHKWILADFSDGKYWGELLINYNLKDDLGVDFSLMDHLLYTRDL